MTSPAVWAKLETALPRELNQLAPVGSLPVTGSFPL
jgi:hypothetical protein